MIHILSLIMTLITYTSANYLSVIDETTLTAMGGIKVTMMISDNDDLITITLSGPSSKYYSIGIGSCVMSGTWALVIPGIDAADGSTPFEQLLGRNSAGQQLDSSFDIIEDTTTGLLRSVTVTRSISTFQTDDSITDDSYYDFTTNDESLTVMWAYGTQAAFSNHGSDQRDCTTLSFAKTLQSDDDDETVKSLTNHILQIFSVDGSYLSGHSTGSLIFVFILLSAVMVYAVYRHCIKEYGHRGNKLLSNDSMDEMQTLINLHDETERYTAI